MSLRLAMGRQLYIRRIAIIGAGLVMAGSYFGTAGHGFGSNAPAQALQDVSKPAQRADLRAGLLHAGSTGADVERVLGHPTVATELGLPGSGDIALLYASEPIRTRVVLNEGRVTSIALDVVYVDQAPLPPRARVIKATMTRDGVTALLGAPDASHRWMEAGREIEQMTFARAGEREFSAFLVDGLVVAVRLGNEKPPGITSMLLPAGVPNTSVGGGLAIGLSPAQASQLLGARESTTHFALKGQPVEYALYHERDGSGLVTLTFIGGVLTAFATWPPDEL
jgi:hypothetical protein